MSGTPSASRPAPPQVPPVVHQGVRYEQDLSAPLAPGAAPGGALAAYDAGSQARLWRIQVYTVPNDAPPGLDHPGRYFRSMSLQDGPGQAQLLIEDEAGSRYAVDLHSRAVSKLSGPSDKVLPPLDTPAPKPKPKPH